MSKHRKRRPNTHPSADNPADANPAIAPMLPSVESEKKLKDVGKSTPRSFGIHAVHVWMTLFSLVLATATFFLGRTIQLGQTLKSLRGEVVELNNTKDSLSKTNAELIEQKWRDVIREEVRIGEATATVEIMGITNARRLHLLRDALISAVGRGVEIRVLFLDPRANEFAEREEFESDSSGRLRLELATGIATLREVWQRVEPERRGLVKVRAYRAKPEFALSGIDADDSRLGEIVVNPYPPEKGARGFTGRLFIYSAREPRDSTTYESYYGNFKALWAASEQYQIDFHAVQPAIAEIKVLAAKSVGGVP